MTYSNYIGPDVSLTAHLYNRLAFYRNEADEDSYEEKIFVAVAFPFVALIGVIETIVRGILSPIACIFCCCPGNAISERGIEQEKITIADMTFALFLGGAVLSGLATVYSVKACYANLFYEEVEVEAGGLPLTIFC